MMQHYLQTKEEYKDCILFYRLGDFYEMFFEDAKTVSKELELTLTGKSCGLEERAPMCGVPFHAADGYINRLVKKGYKVAICEQVEDPKLAKGIVKREVIRVVTPGTNIDMQSLDEAKNNYLMCIVYIGVCHPRNRTADDNIHTTIRKGTLLRIPLRNVPAGKHCGICPAYQSIQKTGRCSQKHGAWLYHQRADDDDGLSRNYDRFHKSGYGRHQRADTAYGTKRHRQRIYDTAHFHSDYPRCRIHSGKYGCRHGETCIRRT